MGSYTSNNHFYKPALGASGEAEKAFFDGALESVDTTLESLQSQINSVEVGSGSSAPILGVTDGYDKDANLDTVLTLIDTTEITLACPAGAITINDNTTIPANVHLRMEKGAYFNISDTKTLTINGTIEAGPYQIFAWTGSGKVIFGTGAASEYNLRWWGATGDSTTDDTAAIQKALDAGSLSSKGSITFVGNPDDIYRVSAINCLYSSDAIHTGRIFTIDGRGALIKQYGIQTSPLLKLYGADIKFVVQNWSLIGNTRYIFYKTGITSAPSTVEIDGNSANSESSIAALTDNYDYYYDGDNDILYIYTTDVSEITYPEELTSGVVVDSETITGWERYLPSSAIQLNVATDTVVRNMAIMDFGIALDLQGSQYGGYYSIFVKRCTTAINSAYNTSNSMGNIFQDFHCYPIYGDMIIWNSGANTIFSKFSSESIRGRVIYVDAVEGVTINGFRLEAMQWFYGSTATSGLHFKDTEGVDIYGNMLSGGGTLYASSMEQLFYFDRARGVNIHGNKLYCTDSTGNPEYQGPLYTGETKKCYLYYAEDIETGGIIFEGNRLNVFRCTNGAPIAIFRNNDMEVNQFLQLPVTQVDQAKVKEYWKDPTFANGYQANPTLTNATTIIDQVVGPVGETTNALKISFTGESPTVKLTLCCTGPTIPVDEYYVSVLGFNYKSDSVLNFKVSITNGPAMGVSALTQDDDVWYRCYVMGNEQLGGTSIHQALIYGEETSGDLWLTDFSLTFHRNKGAATDFIGKATEKYSTPVYNLLPTGNKPSVQKVGGLDNDIWLTQNTTGTEIVNLLNGYPGQTATLRLVDTAANYSKLMGFGTTINSIFSKGYTYYNDGSDHYTDVTLGTAYDYFRNSPGTDPADAVYWMSIYRFCGIGMNIGTATDHTFEWQYYGASGWATLSVSNTALGSTGTQYVYFDPPIDWQQTVVNSQWGWWVRVVVTAGNSEGGANQTGANGCCWMSLQGTFGPKTNMYDLWQITLKYDRIWREVSRTNP